MFQHRCALLNLTTKTVPQLQFNETMLPLLRCLSNLTTIGHHRHHSTQRTSPQRDRTLTLSNSVERRPPNLHNSSVSVTVSSLIMCLKVSRMVCKLTNEMGCCVQKKSRFGFCITRICCTVLNIFGLIFAGSPSEAAQVET